MSAPEPRNIQEACQNPAYAMVLDHLVEKAEPEDLIADLVKDGHDREEAARIVTHGRLLLRQARRFRTFNELVSGVVLLVGGAGVTLFTLLNASEMGGYVVIWHGAIIVGIAQIIRAIYHSNSSMRGWLRQQVGAAMDAGPPVQRAARPLPEQKPSKRSRYDY